MDINTLRGLSTVFVLIAFLGICWWAFSPRRKKRFEEDAKLPFADEEQHQQTRDHEDAEASAAADRDDNEEGQDKK